MHAISVFAETMFDSIPGHCEEERSSGWAPDCVHGLHQHLLSTADCNELDLFV